LTGAAGLSCLIVFVNVELSEAVRRRERKWRPLVAPALILPLVWLWGSAQLQSTPAQTNGRKIRVAILQANIDQYQKWDDAYEASIRKIYEDLLRDAAAQKPDLIVWPESAVPGWFPTQERYRIWVSSVVRASRTYNLVGAVTSRDGKDYNAAFLIAPDGTIAGEYHKQHLVPFGEYVPFGRFLSRWIPYLGQLGTFAAGDGPVVFTAGDVKIAPNICYEAIFADLVRAGVKAGASLIVNVTNDGWFLDTGAPEQHYAANILRAVENRTPVVRAANTGISAVIDAHGREQIRSPLLKRGVYVADVNF
jgi:apolipoprotein N-acyltransferase